MATKVRVAGDSSRAGFKFVWMDFHWRGIEPRKGESDWSGYEELLANVEYLPLGKAVLK